jgi:hypothetical protein
MSEVVYKNHTITLEPDEDAESPDTWENENGVFIVTTNNRYFNPTPKDWTGELDAIMFAARNSKKRIFERSGQRYNVRVLNAYIHSGVHLSLASYAGRLPQGHAEFDSGVIGAVLIKTGVVGRGKAHGVDACAKGLVDAWNMYLSGDVWVYDVKDAEGNVVDTMGGCYGEEYALQEAKAYVDRKENAK